MTMTLANAYIYKVILTIYELSPTSHKSSNDIIVLYTCQHRTKIINVYNKNEIQLYINKQFSAWRNINGNDWQRLQSDDAGTGPLPDKNQTNLHNIPHIYNHTTHMLIPSIPPSKLLSQPPANANAQIHTTILYYTSVTKLTFVGFFYYE